MIQKFATILFGLSIFFLPWQTVMILSGVERSGGLSAYGVFSVYVVEVMIVIAFLLRSRQYTYPRIRFALRSVFFFLAAVFFSLSVSEVEWVGWFHFVHVGSAIVLFLLVVDDRTNLRHVLTFFLAGLLAPILFGWFQVFTGSSPDMSLFGIAAKDVTTPGVAVVESTGQRLLRAYGTFPHPNIFGGYVAFGSIVLAYLTRYIHERRQFAGALLTSAVLGSTLVVTFSRSAWLGIFMACLLIFVFMLWQRRPTPRRTLAVLFLGLASVFVTVIGFHAQVLSRFDVSQRLEVISLEERSSQYELFWDIFLQSPLLGVGPGAYTFVLERQNPGDPVWSYQPIHNVYLLVLAELGTLGIIALGYGLFSINPFAYASLAKAGTWFALSTIILLFTIGLFDHYLWSFWPGLALSALAIGSIVHWAYRSS